MIPFFVDVPMRRFPVAAVGLICATAAVSALVIHGLTEHPTLALWKGHDFRPYQLVTYAFPHADWWHLTANLLFLWVFGSAIDAKLGHLRFLGLYLVFAVLAGLGWLALGHGKAMVGASGAVMGICGMFLVLYPRNDVAMWDDLFALWQGEWVPRIPGVLFVGIFLAFDVWDMVFNRHEAVAFAAHVAGGFVGIGIAIAMLQAGWLEPDEGEQTLLDWIAERPPVSRHRERDPD
jgi:membrane associated rhomboid family serine protease